MIYGEMTLLQLKEKLKKRKGKLAGRKKINRTEFNEFDAFRITRLLRQCPTPTEDIIITLPLLRRDKKKHVNLYLVCWRALAAFARGHRLARLPQLTDVTYHCRCRPTVGLYGTTTSRNQTA